nr:hypothetical protein [Tanacetum cinerariifolium]
MPPTMTTRSAGRPTAASRGEGTGGQAGSGGGGQSREMNGGVEEVPNFSTIIAQQLQNLLPTIVAQIGDQGRGQGNSRNQNDDPVNDHNRGDAGNAIEGNDRRGCTYKEFLACNPKEYDDKGGAIVYTRWIEKMDSVYDMSGCRDSQRKKYTVGSLVDIRTLTREEFFSSNDMQKLETELWNHAMVGDGHAAYTDRFHKLARLVPHLVTLESKRIKRNGTIKKNPEKRGNRGEPSKDRNGREDNKRTRTGNAFASTTNPVREGYTGHFAKDCKVAPRNVNPVNARNLFARTCFEYGQDRGNQWNQARGREFMLGSEEARQDPNIVTGMFTLNNHYATPLFDSGADYSFVSTTFIPLLEKEPNDLGFGYEIEIASRQLVEIDKVIRGCKLEIEGHMFDINLMTFRSGSFDVIIGMDCLSDHKAEIICHEKEIQFQIELIPEAMPVAKSPYRLAPSELEELLGQLKEL